MPVVRNTPLSLSFQRRYNARTLEVYTPLGHQYLRARFIDPTSRYQCWEWNFQPWSVRASANTTVSCSARNNLTFGAQYSTLTTFRKRPNLTNIFFTAGSSAVENPNLKTVKPFWFGKSYWTTPMPDFTDDLYKNRGQIYQDERRDLKLSQQMIFVYVKNRDGSEDGKPIPYQDCWWEVNSPGWWSGNWDVSFGDLRFVRQNETGKTFLQREVGTYVSWRWAVEYSLQTWYLRSWNGMFFRVRIVSSV